VKERWQPDISSGLRGCVSYAFCLRSQAIIFAFLRCRRGVSQHIAGQWWRIIGSFTDVTIVFFKKITNR
ncbi:hypothetical protein, partial [Xenorhabdus eapokensis]|uniref:hypothetical protein n=1 Tax=Xenorhabdus eapokensis TaxID=1873482 RepID=UPI0030DAD83E